MWGVWLSLFLAVALSVAALAVALNQPTEKRVQIVTRPNSYFASASEFQFFNIGTTPTSIPMTTILGANDLYAFAPPNLQILKLGRYYFSYSVYLIVSDVNRVETQLMLNNNPVPGGSDVFTQLAAPSGNLFTTIRGQGMFFVTDPPASLALVITAQSDGTVFSLDIDGSRASLALFLLS